MRQVSDVVAIFASCLVVLSCAPSQKTARDNDSGRVPVTAEGLSELNAGEWHLEKMIHDGQPVALVPDSKITFALQRDGRVTGLATLNRYFGSLELNQKGDITWKGPGLGMTKMAGPPELMKQEDEFIEALGQCRRMYRQGSRLILESGDPALRLVFQQMKP